MLTQIQYQCIRILVIVPVANAGCAARTTVGAVDGLLVLGEGGVLGGAEGGDAVQGALAVTALDLSGLLLLLNVSKLTTY